MLLRTGRINRNAAPESIGRQAFCASGSVRGEEMENLLYHLVLIPGVFILGWLSHSVKVATFQVKTAKRENQEKYRVSRGV